MVDPEGYSSRKVYNTRGDLIRDCDGGGYCASTVYNSFGQATRHTSKRVVPTIITYDANGAVLTETATRSVNGVVESLVTTYVRDALGRETQVTGPDGAVRQPRSTLAVRSPRPPTRWGESPASTSTPKAVAS